VRYINYSNIESLVKLAQSGDTTTKEILSREFTPFILNLSKKSFINSYTPADIQNECYKTLFKCLNLYSPDKHRFVAYAANTIKNSVNHLIRTSIKRSGAEGPAALIFNTCLENMLYSEIEQDDDIILNKALKAKLQAA
jgi:hypothetical protein